MTSLASSLFRLAGEAVALFFRGAPDYEAHLTPEGFLVLSGEPVADLNMAMICGGVAPAERLGEFGSRIQQRSLPCVVFMTVPLSEQLAATAREYGLEHVGGVPLMAFEPTGDLPMRGDYQVEPVATEPGRREAMDLAARSFELPPDAVNRAFGPPLLDAPGLSLFVARKNGEAISTVSTTRAGATVGIWTMGTPPEHQRQGAGYATLAAAIHHHRVRGAKLFYLIATEAGQPLYQKVGFQTIAELAVWVRGHSMQVPG